MKHTRTVSRQKPNLAYVPFEDISWGDVISWTPEYITGLIMAIVNIVMGISTRKGDEP